MSYQQKQTEPGKLYLVTAVIKPSPSGGTELMTTMEKVNSSLQSYSTWTKLLYSFKVTGETKVYAVFEVFNVVGLERRMAGLSLIGNIEVMCEAIIPYEQFARTAEVGEYPQVPFKIGNGENLYCLEFNVDKFAMSMSEFAAIWAEEAKFILEKREAGLNVILYKVIGQRKVIVFVQDKPETIDLLSFKIPLMQLAGGVVDIKCRNIQDLANFTKNIKS